MYKVKILSIGRCKETWLSAALAEYEKRLRGRLTIEWAFAKDNNQLFEWASRQPSIVLDPKGQLLTSEAWSEKMAQLGLRLCFVIGGAEGLPAPFLKQAQFHWSLSPLTFTHQMARLILVEQLYRAMEIERGSQYNK